MVAYRGVCMSSNMTWVFSQSAAIISYEKYLTLSCRLWYSFRFSLVEGTSYAIVHTFLVYDIFLVEDLPSSSLAVTALPWRA